MRKKKKIEICINPVTDAGVPYINFYEFSDMIMVIMDDGTKQYYDWSFGQTELTLNPQIIGHQDEEVLPTGTLVERGIQQTLLS